LTRCIENEPGGFFCEQKQNPYLRTQIGVSEFNLDDDLLSHGETPHYHRRCIVSLLSSGWDQVVPMLYGRQEILELTRFSTLQRIGYVMFVSCKLSVRFVFTTPQSGLFRLSTQESQIAWVLYGQASRAISIG
jgi:hypothetical protein